MSTAASTEPDRHDSSDPARSQLTPPQFTPSQLTPPPFTRSPFMAWLAVFSVTMGIFAIVTTEILPIGLLPSIGSSFTISDGMAGLTMALPGFLAALSAPLVTAMSGRTDRRLLLCAFMLLLTLADFLMAAAPAYWLVLVSRVLVGVTIGGFWSISAGLAGRLVPTGSVRRATAVIFASVPLGSVLGVPLGTWTGHHAGWRTAFVAMGVLAAGVLVMLIAVVPPLPAAQGVRMDVLAGLARQPRTLAALAMTVLVVLAHFGAYTYVAPFLSTVTHAGPGTITLFLLAYGAAGIVGNFAGGSTVGRHPRATFAAAAALISVATLLLPVLGRWDLAALGLLCVWGAAYGAVPVCSQTWFALAVPDSPEASSVLFTASFQATLSIGALTGGLVVDRSSLSAVMTLGGSTAALMVLMVGFQRLRPRLRPRL